MNMYTTALLNAYEYFNIEFDLYGLLKTKKKKNRVGYVFDNTAGVQLICAFHWFRVFSKTIDPYVFALMLQYLPDVNVSHKKYKMVLHMNRKMVVLYHFNYAPNPYYRKIEMFHRFKMTTTERFRKLLVTGYSKAIFDNAPEEELGEWAKIIALISTTKPTYVVLHEIFDQHFMIEVEGKEFMLWFRNQPMIG